MASPIEDGPGLNNQERGLEISAKAARGGDLRAPLRFNITVDLAMNFDFTHFDIGVHDGVFADDERIAAGDGSMEIAIDPEGIGELQLTRDIGPQIKKPGNRFG